MADTLNVVVATRMDFFCEPVFEAFRPREVRIVQTFENFIKK